MSTVTEPSFDTRTRRLIQAVQDLSMARDVARIRQIVRAAAREMVDADGATFVLRDGDECHYVDEDAIGPLWKGQRFPMSACISGWSMIHRKPAAVPDIYRDERIPVDAYRPTFVKSLVMVPIREADPIGAIGTYWATAHEAATETVELLQALANTTAVALENVQVYEELEARVRQRTAELEAANRELNAFSYSISHDLRAPLRRIGSFAQLLLDSTDLGGEHRRYVSRIAASAERMSNLTRDLLAFAQLARAPLKKQPVNLSDVIREARREVMLDAADRAIEWHTPNDAVIVPADGALLKQALINLLSNAVKYTRDRAVADITVDARNDDAAGEVVVSVADNGAGFDADHAHRLFGVFERLHSYSQFQGTGIGLANVRRIIDRHGGRTWAKGATGQGATFWFTLPHLPRPA